MFLACLLCLLIGAGIAFHSDEREMRRKDHTINNLQGKIEKLQRRIYKATGRRT